MRKAKVAATIFGGVTSAVFCGLFALYAASPVVSPVTPKKSVEQISETASDCAAEIMISTTTATTAVTTASKTSTTTTKAISTVSYTTAVDTAYNVVTTASIVQLSAEVSAVDAWAPVSTVQVTTTAAETTQTWTEPSAELVGEVLDYEYQVPEEIDYAEAPEEVYYEEEQTTEEQPYTEPETEPVATEPETEPEVQETIVEEAPAVQESSLPISESDYIILCNAVAHEAGCNWIDITDKAKVVEVIMNRVNSPLYPNSITGVLTQPHQFSGSSSYVNLSTYSAYVTDSVKQAVDLYFADPSAFSHGYYSFYGDGTRNYFS